MKKIKSLIFIMALLLGISSCSVVNTLTRGSTVISSGDTVTISAEEYEELQENQKLVEEIKFLTQEIEDNFLFEYDEEEFNDGVLKGLFKSLDDPYSVFYTEKEFTALKEDTSGQFGGIGIVVSAGESAYITVISPIEGTPGEREGIQSGDEIILIDGESYMATDIDEAVGQMRGEPGTDVELTIRRSKSEGGYQTIDLKITREIIKVQSVSYEMLEGEDNLGYIQLSTFDENTAGDFKAGIEDLKSQGAQGIVMDLRGNPGGLLNSCVEIVDYLVGQGNIVSTVDKDGNEDVEKSDPFSEDIPMVVLINEGSASASEITAGALQDHGRAQVIGSKSFGKGIVQQIYPYKDGRGYKLTVSEYYTPNGNKINGEGVKPDIEVEAQELEEGQSPEDLEDLQLNKAIEVIKGEI